MITYVNREDLLIIKNLEELNIWKFKATGKDPILEIKNLPSGIIQDISIVLKAENGETIEVYWSYGKDEPYFESSCSSQLLKLCTKNTYEFLINSKNEIRRLRLNLTNASGIIEVEEIKIFYIPHVLEIVSQENDLSDSLPCKKVEEEKEFISYEELLKQKRLLQKKLEKLEKEKENLITVPNYKNIKKIALKGKNGYLFLVNDSNNEIRQHFDNSYYNTFNAYIFMKSLNSKKKFCRNSNIKYSFFIIPDKSLVCKDFLPFEVRLIKRNYDSIKNLVSDFIKKLDPTCYFKNNSHINYLGGKELSYCYLNHVDTNFKRENFNKLINEQIRIGDELHNGDLTWDKNWSYSDEEKEDYLNEKVITFRNNNLINLSKDLPEKFRLVRIRKTEHYKNPQSLTNLKVLIFRDSSLDFLKDILSTYFKEILLYWDHWFFNKELIEWYKPDIILEIRTERFLENMKYETI